MDLEQTFIAIVEAGSLNKAAEILGVANSTVSTRLALLEEKLKSILLQRSARGIHLTESGELYYQQLKKAFDLMDAAESQIHKMSTGSYARLSLGMPPGLMKHWLAQPVAEFLNQNPDAQISIRTSDRMLDQILEGHDICFHWGQPPDCNLYAQKLFSDEIILIATHQYLSDNDIRNKPDNIEFLQFTRNFSGETKYQIVERKYLEWFYNRPARITCDSVEAQIALLLQHLGAAILPFSIVRSLLENGKVVDITHLYFPQPFPLSCYAMTYDKPSASSGAQSLISHIKQHFNP